MQVEFQCEVKGSDQWDRIKESVHKLVGVNVERIDPASESMCVQMSNNSVIGINELQEWIESSTGIKTVLKGIGTGTAAVSELKGADGIVGVVRLAQLADGSCFVDGAVTGLPDRTLSINVHEFGDLSEPSFQKIGPPLLRIGNHLMTPGSSSFRMQVPDCDLTSCIGRTLAVTQEKGVVAAGIVARASPVGHNLTKKVCDCSGKTLWEERAESKLKTPLHHAPANF